MSIWHRFLFTTSLFIFSVFQTNAQSDSLDFVGVWQGIPYLGSGWSTNYQFYDNGRFNFNHNQMDCADSVLTESGHYHYDQGILYLDYDSITFISGGTYIPATGSCGSELELTGGVIVTHARESSVALVVASVEPLADYDYLDRILMDDESWFRMLHDPNDY